MPPWEISMNAMSLRHGEVVVPRVGRSNDCHAVFDLERITQQRGTAGGSSAERPASVRNRGLNDIPGAPAPGVDKSIPASRWVRLRRHLAFERSGRRPAHMRGASPHPDRRTTRRVNRNLAMPSSRSNVTMPPRSILCCVSPAGDPHGEAKRSPGESPGRSRWIQAL